MQFATVENLVKSEKKVENFNEKCAKITLLFRRYEFLEFSKNSCSQASESWRFRKKVHVSNIIWHAIRGIFSPRKSFINLFSIISNPAILIVKSWCSTALAATNLFTKAISVAAEQIFFLYADWLWDNKLSTWWS